MAKFCLLPALLFMLCYSVVAIGDEKEQIARECKASTHSFFDSVPLLLDFLRGVAWFFGNLLNAAYFVINTVVITVCEIISSIFSCFKYAIKLVEFLGYAVRAILQVNYNFVSSILEWLAKLGRFVVDALKYLAEGFINAVSSAFRLVFSLIRSIISVIPTGFHRAFHSASTAKNTTGVLLYQSYLGWKYILSTPTSALMTVVKSIQAVIECVLASIWNTGLLLAELFYTVTKAMFRGIEFVGKTVQTCTITGGYQLINLSKLLLHGLQSLVIAAGQSFLWVGRTFVWLISLVFSSLAQGLYNFCSMSGWLLTQAFCGLYKVLYGIGGVSVECVMMLQKLITSIAYSVPGGRWTLLSLVSSTFLLAFAWSVWKVNVFTLAFALLESYIQGVLAYLTTLQIPSFLTFKRTSTADKSGKPLDEKDSNLREQLERERDKNLCVVCQTENKNIVVMPCRHMCMCRNCCAQLFRFQRHHRRACPLCRHTITSTLEIYS